MSLLIVFLTFVLVMNCLFLMLLILIQLPKKEAGAGIAFGGAATDALFGAGSGNALTRLTKYSASFFVALSVVLSVLHMHAAKTSSRRIEQELSRSGGAAAAVAPTPGGPSSQVQTFTSGAATNTTLQNAPTAATNLISGGTAPPAVDPNAPAIQPEIPIPAAPATPAPATPAKP